MTQINDVVSTRIDGNIGYIVLDNPPVNAASHLLRCGIVDALADLTGRVDVIALYAEGRTFVAGADIREFDAPQQDPILPEVINKIEASDTPVIAVIHGTALGGGFEIAMGCHARVAAPSAKLGLPEIHLGLFPGAGGTQRGPRLGGIAATLDIVLTGRPISAQKAVDLGFVDRLIDATPAEAAQQAATLALAGDLPLRKTGTVPTEPDHDAIAAAKAKAARTPDLIAPRNAITAIEASTLPLEDGLTREWQLFMECLDHPQSAAMVHAFFAERTVAKVPGGGTPRDIARCGVIGGGTMGSGIATALLLAGYPVTLIEQNRDAANRARRVIAENLDGAVSRGKLSPAKRKAVSLSTSDDLAALADADLIIEAVFEDMGVKKQIFENLDEIAKPGAILASNTSYLDVNEIASVTNRPGDVLGLHFFSPAHVMRLVEIVIADKTNPDVAATGFALAKRLGKVGVQAGVCDGFIGNRILAHYREAADHLLLDGAQPEQVDRALERWGFAMGPFAVADLAGLDIGWAARKRLAPTRNPNARYLDLPDRICEAGRFGRKTGRGFYIYDGKTRTADPEVIAWLEEERRAKGITPRAFSDEDIVDRFLTAMIAEGARVLEDGIALAAVDIDAVFLFGYGFPRHRGGPMFHADQIGAEELIRRITRWNAEDPLFWRVPALLQNMAQTGRTFADLNKERI